MVNTNRVLENLREAIAEAKAAQAADTDDARLCVVPNGVVTRIIHAFEMIDEGLLTARSTYPDEWQHGCWWAPGGDRYEAGVVCPNHGRVHE